MSWLYPERWPGWMDHARVGGGLFDDAPGLVQMLSSCWQHYSAAAGLAARVSLSPPPKLRVLFREDVLTETQWAPLFAYAKETFRPELSGVVLEADFVPARTEDGLALAEARHFAFVIDSPQHQHMTCFFYLDQRVVGAMDLGQINLLGDRRQLAIQRRLGITRGSDIHTCYQTSPMWDELPEAMQRDLRYLGWTFGFATKAGAPTIHIDTLPAVGFLEGGELLLEEGAQLAPGVATAFYQGLRHERPDPGLRCRILVVPKGVQPARPHLDHVECTLHPHPMEGDLLDIRAWVTSAPMVGDVTLQLDAHPHPIALEGGQPTSEGQLLYHAMIPVGPLPEALQARLTGQNQFGLAFAAHQQQSVTLRRAVSLTLPTQAVLSTAQLKREWELVAHYEAHESAAAFDLADVTLWLQSGAHPPVQLPLASTTPGKLLFRYLPRSIAAQLSLERLSSGDTLRAWITQTRNERPTAAHQSWICQQGNRPDSPLCEYRLVDFDSACRLLPPTPTQLMIAKDDELAIEGHRVQIVTNISPPKNLPEDAATNDPTSDRVADLLLLESRQGPREITLTQQGDGWLTAPQPSAAGTAQAPRKLKALWFSCGHKDQWVEQPGDRNPAGGPCLAFGLGFGSTQEMAQIRSSPDGFRLYRHRQHVPVFIDGVALDTTPHGSEAGHLLESAGWIVIEHALLRYQSHKASGHRQLQLTHFGYTRVRRRGHSRFLLTCGPNDIAAADGPGADAFHIHLHGEKRAGSLTLTTPAPPPPGRPQPFWHQSQDQEQLPQPLIFGENHEHGSLCWSAWSLETTTALSSQTPALGTPLDPPPTEVPDDAAPSTPRMFLELRRPYGRKRFALATKQGRLGFWREGSAFLSAGGTMRPVLALESPRQLSDGTALPGGSLLIGRDVAQADLLLPSHLPLPSLPFALCWHQHHLWLLPIAPETCLIQIHRYPEGRMAIADDRTQSESPAQPSPGAIDITPVEGGKRFFRCGDIVFAISRAKADLLEQPQADWLLSIRGVCHAHPPGESVAIGGPHHLTPLPLLDPVPPFAPDAPLATLYPPALHLQSQGEALFGLQRPAPAHALIDRLKRALQELPLALAGEGTPLHYLVGLGRTTKSPARAVSPSPALAPTTWLHETQALPTHFLSAGDHLHLPPLTLAYQFRTRADGHPSVDRAPAMLALAPPEVLRFRFAKGPSGWQTPEGDTVDALHIGRADPERELERISENLPGELQLSPSFPQGDERCAKVLLSGYAPRVAARLLRKEGQVFLDIPAPAQPEQYHVTLAGTPVQTATLHPIDGEDGPTRFHINHLLSFALVVEDDALQLQLEGYLVGHQGDPARPMRLAQTNRMGRIHLRSPGPQPTVILQTALCPPHFRPHDAAPTLGPLPLGPESSDGTLSLVDVQAWTPPAPLVLRPQGCDRLLWFQTDAAGEFSFPPQEQDATRDTKRWDDEGSSFGFVAGQADEGSSFAFGAPPAPPVDTSTQEELSAAFPTMALGWRSVGDAQAPQVPPTWFGFVSKAGGPQVRLFQAAPGEWTLAPGEPGAGPYPETGISGERQVPLALWQKGRWRPLLEPQTITSETLLLCGPAGFLLRPSTEDRDTIEIARRWLWLPARRKVVLGRGNTPAKQGSTTEHLWLGLGDVAPTPLCEIWPLRRGHIVEQQNPEETKAANGPNGPNGPSDPSDADELDVCFAIEAGPHGEEKE